MAWPISWRWLNAPGTTATRALGPASQARDVIPSGVNGCGTDITTDQRGVSRPQRTTCDIGAFESDAPGDSTPPIITPTVTGVLGNAGWYVSDVTVAWTVHDDDSTVSSTTGCEPTSITSDTTGLTVTCSATSAGGTSTQSVTIKRDAPVPTVTPTVSGTLGSNGWYTSNVTVIWTVTGCAVRD